MPDLAFEIEGAEVANYSTTPTIAVSLAVFFFWQLVVVA